MKFHIRPAFFVDSEENTGYPLTRTLALLRAVETSGNLRVACESLSLSYRRAWDVLMEAEKVLGGAVVDMNRGKGTVLTELGRRLVWADKLIHARFDPLLDSMSMEVESEIQSAIRRVESPLKIFASHGFAVAALNAHLQRNHAPIELSYRGSLEALRALERNTCDVAGFHVPMGEFEEAVFEQFRDAFKPSQVMINIASRRQGLMVRKNNPKNIWAIRDLLRPDVIMVNRQQGSGTRVILDLLLQREGISGQRIAGFESVELTHAAIAAYVASGKADVGLGVETAARQFDLDFVPLLSERYFFICEKQTLEDPRFAEALAFLHSAPFRAQISALPGYDPGQTGTILTCEEAFPNYTVWPKRDATSR